ncbi:hypothetical protein PsAD37_04740 [Pseudovibrio sp. Ad37]|nr:hypothetical protein PsAD37_04740 [Pseudovibrio sp. Ad37]
MNRLGSQLIVAILLDGPANLKLGIGQELTFQHAYKVTIKGWNMWPDNSTIDVILDGDCIEVAVNDKVSLVP